MRIITSIKLKTAMKYLLQLAICCLIFLTACDDKGVENAVWLFPCPEMKVGDECIVDEDLRIRFVDVVEDSRCPVYANCVWPGQAGVSLEYVFQNDLVFTDTLYSLQDVKSVSESQFNKYHITLIEVNPYPQNPLVIPTDDYRIKLDVLTDWFDAEITGFNYTLCPSICCGGLFIALNDEDEVYTNYNYLDLVEGNLDENSFPIPIRIRYDFNSDWPCIIEITELEP
jgi:hypothetical protein